VTASCSPACQRDLSKISLPVSGWMSEMTRRWALRGPSSFSRARALSLPDTYYAEGLGRPGSATAHISFHRHGAVVSAAIRTPVNLPPPAPQGRDGGGACTSRARERDHATLIARVSRLLAGDAVLVAVETSHGPMGRPRLLCAAAPNSVGSLETWPGAWQECDRS
jgi:hypothetical protein